MVSVERRSSNVLLGTLSPDVQGNVVSGFDDSYDILKEIGRGRFAKVCEVKHKTSGRTFAAKMVRRWRNGRDNVEDFARELRIIELCKSSPNIVNMYEHYLRSKDLICILEHARGGDLYDLVHYKSVVLSPDCVKFIVKELLKAVHYLHENNVVHMDIKPDNILLRRPFPDCDVVLCDFGLARFLDRDKPMRNLVGTPDYAAPEILCFDPVHLTTDMWSVGVVTYYLFTGQSPFWAATKEETYTNVTKMNISYPTELFAEVPEEAVCFMKRLIVREPRDRPSAEKGLCDTWLGEPIPNGQESTDLNPSNPSSDLPSLDHLKTIPDITEEGTRSELDRSYGEH